MTPIVATAPALAPASVEQVAALPLGGRVHVDPWTARAELIPAARVPLVSAREKMSFQVTPLMPYLRRYVPANEPVAGRPGGVPEAGSAAGAARSGVAAVADPRPGTR